MDPRDTLKLAETELLLWAEAQNSPIQGVSHTQLPVPSIVPTIPGRWCFTDESWKIRIYFQGKDDIVLWKVLMD